MLTASEPEYYVSFGRLVYGLDIIVHEPYDFPEVLGTYLHAQPNDTLRIPIKITTIVTEPRVRSISRKQRNCLFEDEVYHCFILHTVISYQPKVGSHE